MKIQDLVVETKKVNWMELNDLQPENLKVKMHSEKTKHCITELGFARAIYVWKNPEENDKIYIIDGHTRKDILVELVNDGYSIPKELSCTFLDNKKIKNKKEAVVYLTRVFNVKTDPINEEIFKDMLEDFDLSLDDVCFEDLNVMLGEAAIDLDSLGTQPQTESDRSKISSNHDNKELGGLKKRFLWTPFSIFDTKQGDWQDKKRYWKSKGIDSGEGRELGLAFKIEGDDFVAQKNAKLGGTSIFDPVLCEILYNWYCPKDGLILDCFAGGSVRGIMANFQGMNYIGCELRQEQVDANRKQYEAIYNQHLSSSNECETAAHEFVSDPQALTPIQEISGIFVKRDDLFVVNGVRGGKVRSCYSIISKNKDKYAGVCTAGSRQSPQISIVHAVAKHFNLQSVAHCPQGELSENLKQDKATGCNIIQHKAGYNNVIIARAREYAQANNFLEIPFGMECPEAVTLTARQVENIPNDVKRIVVPLGSGMSLCGILHGLIKFNKNIKVLAVQVGGEYLERMEKYAPNNWESMVEIVKSRHDYHTHCGDRIGDISLDPVYEAKCVEFLEEGDLFWIVGNRESSTQSTNFTDYTCTWICDDSRNILTHCKDVKADLLFSCPPYADLEVYSKDERDISNMAYDDFLIAYRDIIQKSCTLLKDNAFAVFVVGEVRDKKGNYYNFVGDTIQAFKDAGLHYYNEGILLNAIGTMHLRVGGMFKSSRKLGKIHQNILIFCKGDPVIATQNIGAIDFKEELESNAEIDGAEEL